MHLTIMKLKSFQAQKLTTWQDTYFLTYDIHSPQDTYDSVFLF